MSKLEEVMDRRATAEKASEAAKRRTEEAREKKEARQKRLRERSEFNRLFKRLKGLVDGRWDRYGWGWKFEYKGVEYFIKRQSWYCPKDPGDADGYDMRGMEWVLKQGFNASDKQTVTLSSENELKQGLTEAVLRGLKELNQEDGWR